ncbi:MAG: hypothetical protein ACI8YQ_004625 [Polaribacter sp.]|jgi:hypothetical protein
MKIKLVASNIGFTAVGGAELRCTLKGLFIDSPIDLYIEAPYLWFD